LAAGIGAAVIFPVTLSIIVNVFSDRKQRSIAIGVWAATSGLGIGIGPTFGGLLVEHYWWGSSLMLAGSIAVAALLATTMFVPDSRDPSTPPLDVIGLTLSTLGLGTLVYTLIEAPEHGWSSDHTVIGLAVALMVLIGFLLQERRCPHPMLDVMPSRRRGAESLPAVTGFVGGASLSSVFSSLHEGPAAHDASLDGIPGTLLGHTGPSVRRSAQSRVLVQKALVVLELFAERIVAGSATPQTRPRCPRFVRGRSESDRPR
jgi:MFS family permease